MLCGKLWKRWGKGFLPCFAELQGEKQGIVCVREISQPYNIMFHTGISGLVARTGRRSSNWWVWEEWMARGAGGSNLWGYSASLTETMLKVQHLLTSLFNFHLMFNYGEPMLTHLWWCPAGIKDSSSKAAAEVGPHQKGTGSPALIIRDAASLSEGGTSCTSFGMIYLGLLLSSNIALVFIFFV